MSTREKLNAENLKSALWETLQDVRSGEVDPATANSIAGNARGIISTINVEIAIQNSGSKLSETLRDFTK